MSLPLPTGTTPGTKIRVVVGGTYTVMREAHTWLEHAFADVASQGSEDNDNVLFTDRIGWQLMDVRLRGKDFYEGAADAGHVMTPANGNARVGTYVDDGKAIQERYNQRQLTELKSPLAVWTDTAQGDLHIHKQARPVSLPDPPIQAPWETPVPLDRFFVANEQIDADDETSCTFDIRGSSGRSLDEVFRYYFPTLAGTSDQDAEEGLYGTGRYVARFRGDGTMLLCELRNDLSWAFRASYSYCAKGDVLGRRHVFRVSSNAKRRADGKLFGDTVQFGFSTVGLQKPGGNLLESLVNVAIQAIDLAAMSFQTVGYRVPGASVDNQPIPMEVRADARQDCSIKFQSVRRVFESNGTIRCNPFSLVQAPTGDVIQIQLFGSFPAGTSIDLRLFGATSNQECPIVASQGNALTAFRSFAPIAGEISYRPVITLNASADRLKSPTIERVRFIRSAQFKTVTAPEVEVQNVTRVSTTGASSDPSTSSLGLECWDLTGRQNTVFWQKSGMRIRVEADLGPDPSDPSKRLTSVLFRGTVVQAKRQRRAGRGKQGFGGTEDLRKGPISRYTVKAVGEFFRLSKHLAPKRIDLANDGLQGVVGEESQPHKVTDMLRYLLLTILPENRVDVPDLPLRFPLDQGQATFMESYQPVIPIVIGLARDFLGAYLSEDLNASFPEGDPRGTTNEGMWRVRIAPKVSDLKPVAEFCFEPVVEDASPIHPAAYPPRVMPDGRRIPRTFLRQGSLDEWVSAPEANLIVVRGIGAASGGFFGKGTGVLQRILPNWVTAQFEEGQGSSASMPAPDPEDVDYTDGDIVPLYHSDPMLNTDQAVFFLARRLYDLKTHRKRWMAGESPLVFVKPEQTGDPLHVRPRPLIFGDPVSVQGATTVLSEDGSGEVVLDGLFIMADSPAILTEGRQGGSLFLHALNTMFSAPRDDTYRAAYGDAN